MEFKHIENRDMWPNESSHIEYDEVYRAVKNTNTLDTKDFLPWNIEHINQMKTFKRLKLTNYGVSVFTDLDSIKHKVTELPALDGVINAYAKGFTTIKRGVSIKENFEHHVDYFLYDYENNNPKDDFKIVEVRQKT